MVYAPGTLESDPKKQNMALQQHAQGIKANTDDIATNTAAIAALQSGTVTTIAGNSGAFTLNSISGITNTANDIELQQASSSQFGAVKVDNTTITASSGVISATAKIKVITFTFDTSLTTNFSVTGVGFRPKGAFFFATLSATQNVVAWGATDGTTSYELHGRGTTATVPNYGIDTTGASMVFDLITTAGTTACAVALVSVDSDGFTFSRTKTGSPSGTATVFAMCFG